MNRDDKKTLVTKEEHKPVQKKDLFKELSQEPRIILRPAFLLGIVIFSIFFAVAFIVLILHLLPGLQRHPPHIEVLSAAFSSILILFPVIYLFLFKPLKIHIRERIKIEAEQKNTISELNDALEKVKVLSGLLPICASCKRIRDNKGEWTNLEKYISERTEAEFTHSICPECEERLYGSEPH